MVRKPFWARQIVPFLPQAVVGRPRERDIGDLNTKLIEYIGSAELAEFGSVYDIAVDKLASPAWTGCPSTPGEAGSRNPTRRPDGVVYEYRRLYFVAGAPDARGRHLTDRRTIAT